MLIADAAIMSQVVGRPVRVQEWDALGRARPGAERPGDLGAGTGRWWVDVEGNVIVWCDQNAVC